MTRTPDEEMAGCCGCGLLALALLGAILTCGLTLVGAVTVVRWLL